jgi:hypothetical protein
MEPDQVMWKGTKNGEFLVKKTYDQITVEAQNKGWGSARAK